MERERERESERDMERERERGEVRGERGERERYTEREGMSLARRGIRETVSFEQPDLEAKTSAQDTTNSRTSMSVKS